MGSKMGENTTKWGKIAKTTKTTAKTAGNTRKW
jgi:hypothetical protein